MNSTIKILLNFLLFSVLNFIYAQSPNIIFVIADDMGWSQTSSIDTNINNPSDFYETPEIDVLANQGIALTNAYVNGANCAPTRAAILSGQWGSRPTNNVFAVGNLNRGGNNTLLVGPAQGLPNGRDQIPASAITIAETMKTVGYTTAHFGKFHAGGSTDNTPTDQGFDFNYGGNSNGNPGNYFASQSNGVWKFGSQIGPELDAYANPYTSEESLALAGDNSLTGTAKHVTDAITAAGIDFMNAHNENPFFMHFSYYAIHGPWGQANARPDLYAKYVDKNNSNPSQIGHNNLGQAAILEGMDQSLGRLIDYLQNTPDPRNPGNMLAANTLVYFTSDNGGANGPQDNIPLKGMKGEYTEGGIRSVSFAWSQGLLANMAAPNNTPVQAFDIYPTFAEMAGASLPENYDIDGVSLWSMLNGTSTDLDRESLYWHFPGYLIDNKRDQRPTSVIRKGAYKLIYEYETTSYQLYNLSTDISEANDLLLDSPDNTILTIANDMSTDLRNYLINVNAPLPTYRSNGNTVPLPEVIPLDNTPPVTSCVLNTYAALWNFDTTVNTDDISANNNDALALTGAVSYDTTDFKEGNQSVVFDGTTKIQYSQNPGPFMIAATSARSVTMWVKPSSFSGIQNLFEEGGSFRGFVIRLNGTDVETIVRNSETTFDSLTAPFPTDGDWHHLALVYNGAVGTHELYIDGVVISSSNEAAALIDTHSGAGGLAGVQVRDSFGETADNFYSGKMDAVAVYEIALSETQVSEAACLDNTPPTCTNVVVNSEDFEAGWGIWNDGGSDARRSINDAAYANSGSYCIRLRDNTNTSVITSNTINAISYETITVDFSYFCRSMEGVEDFWLQISTDGGSNYTTVEEWNLGDEFVNNQRYNEQVEIEGPFTANTLIRFRADASGNSDWVYLDDIIINACESVQAKSNLVSSDASILDAPIAQTQEMKSIVVYPSPFTNEFTIGIEEGTYQSVSVEVYDIKGKQVASEIFDANDRISIQGLHWAKGQYFAKITIDQRMFVKQLIKK